MKIPSFFMGKIIVTLFPFTDIPSGMKPSATKSSVLTRHPGSALNSRKVPKMPCFCGFYGVGSNEPVDEPSGFKRRGKIKLYQRRSYYAYERPEATSVSGLFLLSMRVFWLYDFAKCHRILQFVCIVCVKNAHGNAHENRTTCPGEEWPPALPRWHRHIDVRPRGKCAGMWS